MAEVRLDKFQNLGLGIPASAFAFMELSCFPTLQQPRMKDHRRGGWGSPQLRCSLNPAVWGSLEIKSGQEAHWTLINIASQTNNQTLRLPHTQKTPFVCFALPCFTATTKADRRASTQEDVSYPCFPGEPSFPTQWPSEALAKIIRSNAVLDMVEHDFIPGLRRWRQEDLWSSRPSWFM